MSQKKKKDKKIDQEDEAALKEKEGKAALEKKDRIEHLRSSRQQRQREASEYLSGVIGDKSSPTFKFQMKLLLRKLEENKEKAATATAPMTDTDDEPRLTEEEIKAEIERIRLAHGRYLQRVEKYIACCHRGYRRINGKTIDNLALEFIEEIGPLNDQVIRRVVGVDPGTTHLYECAAADYGMNKGDAEKDQEHRNALREERDLKKKSLSKKTAHRLRARNRQFTSRTTASVYHHAGVTRNVKRGNIRVEEREPLQEVKFGDDALGRTKTSIHHELDARRAYGQAEDAEDVLSGLAGSSRRIQTQLDLCAVDISQNVLTIAFLGAWSLNHIGRSGRFSSAPAGGFASRLVQDPNIITIFLGEQFSSQVPPETNWKSYEKKNLLKKLRGLYGRGTINGTVSTHEGHCRCRDEVGALNILRKGLAFFANTQDDLPSPLLSHYG